MKTKRLNLIVNQETEETLNSTRDFRGLSYTDQVQRGVKILKYVMETQDAGGRLVLYDKDGEQLAVVKVI